MDNQDKNLSREEFTDNITGEGLSFSDYFDDSVPYEVKPVPNVMPMEEMDWPIQAKDLFKGLFEETPKSQLKLSPLIQETDSVFYKDETYHWDEDAASVVLVYESEGSKGFYVASVFGSPPLKRRFYSSWDELAERLNHNADVSDSETHGDLDLAIDENAPEYKGRNVLQGRLFEIQDNHYRYILGFWEPAEIVKSFRSVIFEYLREIGVDPEKILWSYSDGLEVITYDQMFDIKRKAKKRSKEQLELLKQIHLNAALKKKVLKLPPHPFYLLADKLGVTVTQLRQIVGMDVAESVEPPIPPTLEQLVESVQRGEGFWLDPKGVFHNVDVNGNRGHLDWATKFFKRPMTYKDVFDMGFVWVGVSPDTINFLYDEVQPSATQMYMLKKTAADDGYKLRNLKNRSDVNVSDFHGRVEETDQFEYNGVEFSYDDQGVSVLVVYKNTSNRIPLKKFYVAGVMMRQNKENHFISDWKELEIALNEVAEPSYDETHIDVKSSVKLALQQIGIPYNLAENIAFGGSVLDGRLFASRLFEGGYCMGFWQRAVSIKSHYSLVEDYLNRIGIKNPRGILWAVDGGDIIGDFNRIFGGRIKGTKTKAQIELQRKLHVMDARLKKQLLHSPINRLQSLADKAGIPLVQLRQMLGSMDEVETAIDLRGRKVDWEDATGIFTIWDAGKWVAMKRRGGGKSVTYFSSLKDIQKELNSDKEYQHEEHGNDDYLVTHSNLFTQAIKAGENSGNYFLSGVDEDYLGDVGARVFKMRGKTVVGFWQDMKHIRNWWTETERILRTVFGVDVENARYTFNNYYTKRFEHDYWQVTGKKKTKIRTVDPAKLALMKLQHLSPEAKKALLKVPTNRLQFAADKLGITTIELRQLLGRDIAETILKESPDYITLPDNTSHDYCEDAVIGPFSCGYFYGERGWAYYHRPTGDIIHDGRSLFDAGEGECYTHGSLLGFIFGDDEEGDPIDDNYERGVHGRLYKIKDRYYVSIWERKEKLLQWKKEIVECLEDMGADPKTTMWQFGLMGRTGWADYYETFDETKPEKVGDTEENLAKAYQLHLLPPAKKAELLKQMGAAGPQKIQMAADKMGMTVAQLRQALGRTDEGVNDSLNATLIWIEKDGTVYDTNDTQHGIYVADNPGMFGVNRDFVERVFKKFGEDYDSAAAIMCEQAFKKKWMRVVKIPWRNKIMVEGQEPTREQLRVFEGWFFEDKDTDIIWQRWVTSKFGPAQPVTLFSSKNVLETNK